MIEFGKWDERRKQRNKWRKSANYLLGILNKL